MKKRKSQLPGDILLVLIMILVLFPLVWLYVSGAPDAGEHGLVRGAGNGDFTRR